MRFSNKCVITLMVARCISNLNHVMCQYLFFSHNTDTFMRIFLCHLPIVPFNQLTVLSTPISTTPHRSLPLKKFATPSWEKKYTQNERPVKIASSPQPHIHIQPRRDSPYSNWVSMRIQSMPTKQQHTNNKNGRFSYTKMLNITSRGQFGFHPRIPFAQAEAIYEVGTNNMIWFF